MADEEYTGRVVVRTINPGSKSEHRTASLETPGGLLPLRRPSSPPFHDPVLLRLEGSTIRCRGQLHDGKLVLSSWRKVKEEAEPSQDASMTPPLRRGGSRRSKKVTLPKRHRRDPGRSNT